MRQASHRGMAERLCSRKVLYPHCKLGLAPLNIRLP